MPVKSPQIKITRPAGVRHPLLTPAPIEECGQTVCMVERTCAGCGRSFKAADYRAKTCSNSCRSRVNRARKAAEPVVAALVGDIPFPEGAVAVGEGCEALVVQALTQANRLRTVKGQIAIALARRVDAATVVMGFAALTKELERAYESAMAGVTAEADPLDEIRARRDAKLRD